MAIRRALRTVLTIGGLLACCLVLFYGFDAVVAGVLVQVQTADHLRGAGLATMVVVPFL